VSSRLIERRPIASVARAAVRVTLRIKLRKILARQGHLLDT